MTINHTKTEVLAISDYEYLTSIALTFCEFKLN